MSLTHMSQADIKYIIFAFFKAFLTISQANNAFISKLILFISYIWSIFEPITINFFLV